MYLIQDLTPGARAVSVQCLACGKMVQLSNALIDRDGPAFQAYYHFGCAPSREVHERITCEYGTRNRVEKFNPPLLIDAPVLYETCRRCGDKKRRDASCECQLADAERATGVQ